MSIKKRRILVVDDEPDVNLTIKLALENEGFEVDTYNDPIQALSNFKTGLYDLLLIDIKMPKMDGFELYKKLQQIDQKVKICFITAFELYYDKFKRIFPKINIRCFVSKPVSIGDLANK